MPVGRQWAPLTGPKRADLRPRVGAICNWPKAANKRRRQLIKARETVALAGNKTSERAPSGGVAFSTFNSSPSRRRVESKLGNNCTARELPSGGSGTRPSKCERPSNVGRGQQEHDEASSWVEHKGNKLEPRKKRQQLSRLYVGATLLLLALQLPATLLLGWEAGSMANINVSGHRVIGLEFASQVGHWPRLANENQLEAAAASSVGQGNGGNSSKPSRRLFRRWIAMQPTGHHLTTGKLTQASGDSSRIVALAGRSIELACPLANELLASATGGTATITASNPAASQRIIWRKDGIKLTQLDPRLRLNATNGSLTVLRTQPKLDEGAYECQLIGAGADGDEMQPLKVHRVELRLFVAPRLAPFEFAPDAQVGQRALLTCSALEGQRPISFVWLKDNQIISGSADDSGGQLEGSMQQQQQQQPQLIPQRAQKQKKRLLASTLQQLHQQQLVDKMALSSSSGGSLPSSSVGPIIAEYSLVGDEEAHDGPMDLEDQEVGRDPAKAEPAMVGSANQHNNHNHKRPLGSQLSDSSIRIRQADDYSILSIEPLELKHSGRYTCSAQNEASRASHSAQLVINAPPTLTIEPKDSDLVSGQSTVIECAAMGQPRPTISWLRARESAASKQWDFVPIYDNLRYAQLPNGSLAISNATQREQGHYLCSAKNGFGPEVTKLIKITVHEPARLLARYKTSESRIDERALISCSATGEPPIKLLWFDKESKLIDKSDKRFIIDDDHPNDAAQSEQNLGTQSSASEANVTSNGASISVSQQPANLVESKLIIARASRQDSGHYTCQASNKHGIDKMVINLLVLDVPDKVNELKVTNVTSSTISLRWQLGFTGNSPVSSYLVQYQSDDPLDDFLMSIQQQQQQQQQPKPQMEQSPDLAMTSISPASASLDASQSLQDLPISNNPAASLKAALEALASPAASGSSSAASLSSSSSLSASASSSALPSIADEAIDRTLVELTVEQSASNLIIKDLNPFCVYRLRLAGINKVGLGEFSDWIRAKTEESSPSGSPLKVSGSATGPNSIKLTWLPPDRRTWNGQLIRFNIGYRPIDSVFEFNKSLDWSPPSLQSLAMSLDGTTTDGPGSAAASTSKRPNATPASPASFLQPGQRNATSFRSNKPIPANSKASFAGSNSSSAMDFTKDTANPSASSSLRQHLRQLLALQQQELVAHLTNLQRSTTYLVWIQAANSRGLGPQSHAITVKTLDDVPPSAPSLRIQSATPSSITLAWSMPNNFVSPANQYYLYYRRLPSLIAPNGTNLSDTDNHGDLAALAAQASNQLAEPGPFIERTISSQQLLLTTTTTSGNSMVMPSDQQLHLDTIGTGQHVESPFAITNGAISRSQLQQQQLYQQFVYTLDQLECGSAYELYMTTRNSVGKSEPSALVTTRTLGEPPLAPPNKSSLFSRIGAQDVLLNLASWSSGGCPVTHISIRYKPTQAPTASASMANLIGSSSASATYQNASSIATNSSSTQSITSAATLQAPPRPISTSVPANLLAAINAPILGINRQQQQQQQQQPYASPAAHLLALDANLAQNLGNQYQQEHNYANHPQAAPFVLKNLQPSTGYELEMIAHNAAGQTSAQYEFVTAGPNGSRSGYTRREGVQRLDQRGQLLSDGSSVTGNNNNYLDHQSNNADQTGQVAQLVPIALTLLCFVCFIISSTFCYYRLSDAWKRQRRHNHSHDDDSNDPANMIPTNNSVGLSPGSSSLNRKSVLNWNQHQQSTLRHHHHHHPHHHHHLNHQLEVDTHDHDGQSSSDSPQSSGGQLHYCLRDPRVSTAAGPTATLGHHQAKSGFTQSVSMRDFGLVGPLGSHSSTLNPKSSAFGHRASHVASNTLKLGHGHIGLLDESQQQQQPRVAYGSATRQQNVYQPGSTFNSGNGVSQNETSWTTATLAANHHHQAATTSANYAIPTGAYGFNGLNGTMGDQTRSAYDSVTSTAATAATANHQIIYSGPTGHHQQQQGTYGQNSIDACIQHLMNEQQQNQQYSLAVGYNQSNLCNYANESLEFCETGSIIQQPRQQEEQLNQQDNVDLQQATNLTMNNNPANGSSISGAQSMVDSGTGGSSTSGIGSSSAITNHYHYHMNNNYDSTPAGQTLQQLEMK